MSNSKETSYYQEFNDIQYNFYTSIQIFQNYSYYELKKHGYSIINNLAKGFPHLAEMIGNMSGIDWKGYESPAILKAMQYKLINQYAAGNRRILPQFIYFKNLKPETEKKERKSKKTQKGLEFDIETRIDICSLLMIDTKTFEYLKYSPKIQSIGKQILVAYTQKIQKESH